MTDSLRRSTLLVGALLVLVAAVLASLALGARQVPLGEVFAAFTDFAGTDDHLTVREVRLPRTGLAVLVGSALAVAGALAQTLTRNPLAEPGILGVTAGAAFAVVVGTAYAGMDSQAAQLLLACLGAAAATITVYLVGRRSPLRMVLAGVALSAVLAGLTLGIRVLEPDALDHYRFWSVGSLAGREQAPLLLPVLAIVGALAGALLVTRALNAIALGETVAHTLGTNVRRVQGVVVLLVTVLAGAATAVAGPIVFLGLIVPHLARRLAAGSVPWLLAYTLVLGPVLLLSADVLARLLLPTGEVPVAVVTAFLGGPALIWVVRRYGEVAL